MNYLKLFLFSKKSLVLPKKVNILIYDYINFDFIKSNFNIKSLGLLEARGESFNLPILFISLFQSIYKSQNLKMLYFFNYVYYVKPKYLLTFFDNNVFFYKLSSLLKQNMNLITISYQNGVRQNDKVDIFAKISNLNNLKCNYIFTLSKSYNLQYKKYIDCKTIHSGSFRSNHFNILCNKKKYNYTFISQLENFDILSYEFRSFFYQAENHLLSFLNRFNFLKDNDLNILLRSNNSEEINYFNKIFTNKKINFISKSSDFLKTFEIIDMSNLVMTIDSTLGIESLSRNTKTIFFSTRKFFGVGESAYFGWPVKTQDIGEFWTNLANFDIYQKLIKNMQKLKIEEWEIIKNKYSNFISRDFKNIKLQNLIN